MCICARSVYLPTMYPRWVRGVGWGWWNSCFVCRMNMNNWRGYSVCGVPAAGNNNTLSTNGCNCDLQHVFAHRNTVECEATEIYAASKYSPAIGIWAAFELDAIIFAATCKCATQSTPDARPHDDECTTRITMYILWLDLVRTGQRTRDCLQVNNCAKSASGVVSIT